MTENATSVTELDELSPVALDFAGFDHDEFKQLKLVIKNTFADQPSDAWDDAAYLTVGPREINGWSATIAALPTTYAPLSHYTANGDSAEVLHGGLVKTATDTIGLLIRGSQSGLPASGIAQDSAIRLDNSDGLVAAKFGFPTTPGTTLKLANRVWGGIIELEATDGAGNTEKVFEGNPAGAAVLPFDGVDKLSTTSSGVDVFGAVNGLVLISDGDSETGRISKVSTGPLIIRNDESGGLLRLEVRNVADTADEVGIEITPDAEVTLNYNNVQKAQTGAGGFLVSGQLDISDAAPTAISHATRKDYVDAADALLLPLAGGTVTGQIKGITPAAAADLTRKDYVESWAEFDNAEERISVGNRQVLSGTGTGNGSGNLTVIFDEPFDVNPDVVAIAQTSSTPFACRVTVISPTQITINCEAVNQDIMWIASGRRIRF